MNKQSARLELQTDASGVQCWVFDKAAQKAIAGLPSYPILKAQAADLLARGADYLPVPAFGIDLFNLIVTEDGAVWLAHGDVVNIAALELVEGGLLSHPCHMVCDGVADPVGEVIAEDAALRFKMGRNVDGGVTLTRKTDKPELSKVQQVALYSAVAIALEVQRQVGESVRITVQIDPSDEKALCYIVTSVNGEATQLQCHATPLDRLAQMAALLAKGE